MTRCVEKEILSFFLLAYTFIGGFLLDVQGLPILNESIRNLYFHVTMWFTMMALFIVSVVYSVKYLNTFNHTYDVFASKFAAAGSLFGVLGYATGTIRANYTWLSDQNQSLEVS